MDKNSPHEDVQASIPVARIITKAKRELASIILHKGYNKKSPPNTSLYWNSLVMFSVFIRKLPFLCGPKLVQRVVTIQNGDNMEELFLVIKGDVCV